MIDAKSPFTNYPRGAILGVALFGLAKRKSEKTKVRISKVLSDHAIANTWWDPSALPNWLTEQFYVEQIQPQLVAMKVRKLSETMHVSMAYAALVRTGKRRPHPRHWKELANLVGAS